MITKKRAAHLQPVFSVSFQGIRERSQSSAETTASAFGWISQASVSAILVSAGPTSS